MLNAPALRNFPDKAAGGYDEEAEGWRQVNISSGNTPRERLGRGECSVRDRVTIKQPITERVRKK